MLVDRIEGGAVATSIDVDRLPRGSRGWRTFVSSLTEADDTAESDWLELKSEIDLSRTGAAKIAKFILGAANRQPESAARSLEGYAVMVLGVGGGAIIGIEPVEDMELEKRIQPFLGAEGPQWETARIAVADGRDVLAIMVAPPKPGDPIYVCRKDGDGVADGDVYVRVRGATRRAKSGEMDLLRARERGGLPSIDLEVSVAGAVRAYACDPTVLDDYIDQRRRYLIELLPKPKPVPHLVAGESTLGALGEMLASNGNWPNLSPNLAAIASATTIPEDRTQDAYREAVETWATVCRGSLLGVLDGYVARRATPTTFIVRNLTSHYLVDLRLNLHLAGEVEQIDAGRRDSFLVHSFLPGEPRPWGPRQRDLGYGFQIPRDLFASTLVNLPRASGPRATFRNGGSVDATLELPELRPRDTEELGDDIVLVVRDPSMTVIQGEWTATARDINAVFEGACTVPVDDPVDLTDQIRASLVGKD